MSEKFIVNVKLDNINNMDIEELEKAYNELAAHAEFLRIVINRRREASKKFYSHKNCPK